ncbi:ATP-grasp domain-containing protein [Mesorhizobium sp. M1A.F.Ca.IN.020.03.2.1]|uniref:ATP-grasp domain-containing protein n=2 Tax=Mesorhizobium TaxID=68287 RepID=UPI000FCB0847|nr:MULTISPECIES: acetyl-CoA carboxylase biotin carboxylase subunit family protein [unclassified Mesorhizobium]RUV08347.1 ATP-grasp domain-containing protein [Mesorhizobium sp. M1A.F.Ca.IN.020.03.2.1]RUV25076.1 ATP-grasp domain-containing protein [Mesorhizobium sp. M1A.F.Ca.IN.022.04.1.1]RWB32784.1 MAG: ATP-grasp domain-containing protein [Mesorhizobium sp.]RWD10767.1 MAG: ATP-grasp domain-containing protein [Mesorhizobium sp.]RWE66981.1 MAG: ATP-grasp domain-containing protein [Mesorhizobium s
MARRALILIEGTRNAGPLYVQAAQDHGLDPIILSADPARYDYLAAERVEAIRVDTDSLDALIGECSRLSATYDIAGITSSAESFYATAGKLCRYFDLPGPNPASIERCCDKFTQRQLLEEAGVPMPAYRLAVNAADVEISAAEIGLPVIVKPIVGSGSRGVRLCRSIDELAEHTTHLLGGKHIWRSPQRILVEEFAQGVYYTASIMGNEVIGIATAEFGPPPHFVFRETILPAPLTADEYTRIADVSLSCLKALGLGWGPTSIEFRWTKNGPVVIEVNPRLAGGTTAQRFQLAFGIDLITEHIKLVVGEKWDLRRRHSHTVAARYLIPDRDGTLDWIGGDIQAAAVPGVAEVKFNVQPKTPIVRRGDYTDSLGYVIAASPSLARTQEILQHAVGLIGWSITPFSTLNEQEQGAADYLPD